MNPTHTYLIYFPGWLSRKYNESYVCRKNRTCFRTPISLAHANFPTWSYVLVKVLVRDTYVKPFRRTLNCWNHRLITFFDLFVESMWIHIKVYKSWLECTVITLWIVSKDKLFAKQELNSWQAHVLAFWSIESSVGCWLYWSNTVVYKSFFYLQHSLTHLVHTSLQIAFNTLRFCKYKHYLLP